MNNDLPKAERDPDSIQHQIPQADQRIHLGSRYADPGSDQSFEVMMVGVWGAALGMCLALALSVSGMAAWLGEFIFAVLALPAAFMAATIVIVFVLPVFIFVWLANASLGFFLSPKIASVLAAGLLCFLFHLWFVASGFTETPQATTYLFWLCAWLHTFTMTGAWLASHRRSLKVKNPAAHKRQFDLKLLMIVTVWIAVGAALIRSLSLPLEKWMQVVQAFGIGLAFTAIVVLVLPDRILRRRG